MIISQVVFFWILLVRQIMQFYNTNPEKIPKPASEGWVSTNSKQGHIELSEQEQTQIKNIFDLFDTDGGGSIDSDEMDAAMFALGFQPASERNCDRISGQESRQVTLNDFTSMMKGEMMITSPLDAIWAAFASLSSENNGDQVPATASEKKQVSCDGWGTVTIEGLRRACREFNILMSDEELKDMMGAADMDSGGTVDREEFMRIMHHAPWF